MQKFDTLVSTTQLLSQSGKLLKAATPDPSQPLKAELSVTGKWHTKSSSCHRARN